MREHAVMLPHYVRPLFHAEQTCCPGEVVGDRRQTRRDDPRPPSIRMLTRWVPGEIATRASHTPTPAGARLSAPQSRKSAVSSTWSAWATRTPYGASCPSSATRRAASSRTFTPPSVPSHSKMAYLSSETNRSMDGGWGSCSSWCMRVAHGAVLTCRCCTDASAGLSVRPQHRAAGGRRHARSKMRHAWSVTQTVARPS